MNRGLHRALALAAVLSLPACSAVRMELEPAVPLCRTTTPPEAAVVPWITPFDANDRRRLRPWCEPVGAIARHDPGATAVNDDRPLVVVSWNMAVGGGKLDDLLEKARSEAQGQVEPHLILLIQEAYRANDVPKGCPPNSGLGGRLGPRRAATSVDIVQEGRRLRMYTAYVPSMRNGSDCDEEPREDRGNAILSTLPLSDVVAIELPFAQQRRVAVSATVRRGSAALKIVSAHLDTVSGHKRQAQAIWKTAETLGWQDPIVVGGDFNARPLDPGVNEMKKKFTEVDCGAGPTHEIGLRLDRMFYRGLAEAPVCMTSAGRFGSDHSALIARLPAPRR